MAMQSTKPLAEMPSNEPQSETPTVFTDIRNGRRLLGGFALTILLLIAFEILRTI